MHPAQITVVVIVFNDADRITTAVESALAQGAAVGEVIVVDDASTDGSREAVDALAARHPRVRPLHRTENSGGCGSPRNDGIAAAAFPYVMFLDSDDVYPPGAVDALLAEAAPGIDVVAGACVRRELPENHDTVWAPALYDTSAGATLPGTVLKGIAAHPEFLVDTLSVNKLYRRDFLAEHAAVFPDGAFHYEDFVFTAKVYAAAPRMAVIDTPVYIWHVRRADAVLSISLRRATLANWEHRVEAHRRVVEVFRTAGQPDLAVAAQTKFLDYDLPMYVRELAQRAPDYRAAWWAHARTYLAGFDAAAHEHAQAPARWLARALTAWEEPAELERVMALAAQPPRLLPPSYTNAAGQPVLSGRQPEVLLHGLTDLPADKLPVTVNGTVSVGHSLGFTLTVPELHGLLAPLNPQRAVLRLTDQHDVLPAKIREQPLHRTGDSWQAAFEVTTKDLADAARLVSWRVQADVVCAGGERIPAEVRAAHPGVARRRVVPRLGRPLLVQIHVTPRGALMVRIAGGLHGMLDVLRRRLKRLLAR
ncbi:transferase [Streptomyces spiroverticillatus]|uniref:Transferase n=1 Tax=Streptomyces finlayi TaxID=67296 RepID=A0A918WY47_9ACTN|nr:glycosyltransferase family 2 protein [Streptomyces finlayi]GHA12272.1 transferase [Streptomyces spiroverticillatus]GHC94469.1 transferase [Streptomyces finlayi]